MCDFNGRIVDALFCDGKFYCVVRRICFITETERKSV